MTSGYMNQGTLTEQAALMSFQDGKMQVVADFETVTEDSCASGFPGSSARASVISIVAATAGKMPKLQQDNYAAGCNKTKRWKFVSKGKLEQ